MITDKLDVILLSDVREVKDTEKHTSPIVTKMSQEMSKIALFWLRLTQRDLSRFIGSTSGK